MIIFDAKQYAIDESKSSFSGRLDLEERTIHWGCDLAGEVLMSEAQETFGPTIDLYFPNWKIPSFPGLRSKSFRFPAEADGSIYLFDHVEFVSGTVEVSLASSTSLRIAGVAKCDDDFPEVSFDSIVEFVGVWVVPPMPQKLETISSLLAACTDSSQLKPRVVRSDGTLSERILFSPLG